MKADQRPVLLRSIILSVITCLVILLGSSCNRNGKNQSAIIPEDETIATINNKKISLSDYQKQLNVFLERYRSIVHTENMQLAEIKQIVLDKLIESELIMQEATRKGIKVTDEEVENIAAEALTPYKNRSFEKVLSSRNMTEKEWKNRIRQYLVRQKLIETEVISNIPVTKREISSYYKKHKKDFQISEAFRVRNITLATEEEAKAVLRQIKRGVSFVKLVREHSISPDKITDGDLGYIERGVVPLELENAIFKLGFRKFRSPLSGVVRSQDGFHIFRLIKYRKRKTLSQKTASGKIKDILIKQKQDRAYATWISHLKKRTKISVDKAMLTSEEGF